MSCFDFEYRKNVITDEKAVMSCYMAFILCPFLANILMCGHLEVYRLALNPIGKIQQN